MISILIPSYNFDIYDLVKSIHIQVKKEKIEFQIICIEDGSINIFSNPKVQKLENVSYQFLNKNIGRSKIRNLLAEKSRFNWLLFIDCDSKINNENYIKTYIKNINNMNNIFYGGTKYQETPPEKDKKLHWLYGKKIESKRKRKIFSSHHFLIHKKVFNQIKFDEKIKKYGHEDTVLWVQLTQKKYKFHYIKNSILHIGLEKNTEFIKKSEDALKNLFTLSKRYNLKNISIIKTHKFLSMFFLDYLIIVLFRFFKNLILKNLNSKNPNIFLFQFYKLGYYCNYSKVN